MVRRLLATGAILIILGLPPLALAEASCQFVLGFKALHDLDSLDIGECQDNQFLGNANGDQWQHTSKGLMVWRKADNWTAFTNGYQTWINGPAGLARRLNTELFPWEGDAVSRPNVAIDPRLLDAVDLLVRFDTDRTTQYMRAIDVQGTSITVGETGQTLGWFRPADNVIVVSSRLLNEDVHVQAAQIGNSSSFVLDQWKAADFNSIESCLMAFVRATNHTAEVWKYFYPTGQSASKSLTQMSFDSLALVAADPAQLASVVRTIYRTSCPLNHP